MRRRVRRVAVPHEATALNLLALPEFAAALRHWCWAVAAQRRGTSKVRDRLRELLYAIEVVWCILAL
jgi:hypothetical protein